MLADYGPGLAGIKATVDHMVSGRRMEATLSQEGASPGEISVIFSGQAAGRYSINLEFEGRPLRGFPTHINLHPGDAHPSKTTIVGLQSKTVVSEKCIGNFLQKLL